MTQPPKKYRRKVSDDRVAEVKKRFDDMDIISVLICPSVVRGVLEADAEVIEVYLDRLLTNLKQFNAEWEEIE
jgi:hypothetical protein